MIRSVASGNLQDKLSFWPTKSKRRQRRQLNSVSQCRSRPQDNQVGGRGDADADGDEDGCAMKKELLYMLRFTLMPRRKESA